MDALTLNWVGGEHRFRLRIGELRALQTTRSAGPEQIFIRLRAGSWEVDDIVQVIRFGLVGSGEMPADKAATFVTPLIDLHPLSELKLTALAVLAHSILGPADESAGEEAGATETPLAK